MAGKPPREVVWLCTHGMYLSEKTLYCMLQKCIKQKDVTSARMLHSLILSNQFTSESIIADHLIRLFASCGKLLEASLVFHAVTNPSMYTWLAIVSAYTINGERTQAFYLYHHMHEQGMLPSTVLYACVLKSCGSFRDLEQGRQIHRQIIEHAHELDVTIGSTLIDMYAKCGHLSDARKTFDTLPSRNVVSWSAMLSGYTQHGANLPALGLVKEMHEQQVQPDKVMYQCILQVCGSTIAVEQARITHDQIIQNQYESDIVIGSALIDMYCKCGRIEDAYKTFDSLPHVNEVTWAALITGYVQHGDFCRALVLFSAMQETKVYVDKVIYLCIMKACSSLGSIELAMILYDQIVRKSFECDVLVANACINMYGKCGSPYDARKVFDELHDRQDAISLTVMMAGYVQHGFWYTALELFGKMKQVDIEFDDIVYMYSLNACSGLCELHLGKLIHIEILNRGIECKSVLGMALINMYAKCGNLDDSHMVFEKFQDRSIAVWTTLISGYVDQGATPIALRLFGVMLGDGHSPSKVSFLCILKACQPAEHLKWGKLLHALIFEHKAEQDSCIGSSLVDMYCNYGLLDDAQSVFETLEARNCVMWTALICGYAQYGDPDMVFDLFGQMNLEGINPDRVIFICMLKLCTLNKSVNTCFLVHDQIIKCGLHRDSDVGSTLTDTYSTSGNILEAHNVFDRLPKWDLISWCSIISAYSQHADGFPVLDFFKRMQGEGLAPNKVILLCTLCACCDQGAFQEAKLVHIEIVKGNFGDDTMIGSSLIHMYCKSGSLEDACQVFDGLSHRDVVLWSVIIAGYAQHGHDLGALNLFVEMQRGGVLPNVSTFLSVLKACGSIGSLALGYVMHVWVIQHDGGSDMYIGNALVAMYASCGGFKDAAKVFSALYDCDLISWRAIIGGYGEDGQYGAVRECIKYMEIEGLVPEDMTCSTILSACSHGGQVEDGQAYLNYMIECHETLPNSEHVNCMVDLLARAGQLEEAEKVLSTMPTSMNVTGWISLLSSCKTYCNVEVGRRCFDQIIEIDSDCAPGYALMLNLYANAGLWEEFRRLHEMRKCSKGWKKPGQAWIGVEDDLHKFVIGEQSYPQNEDVHACLNDVTNSIKSRGFVPHVDSVSELEMNPQHDVSLLAEEYTFGPENIAFALKCYNPDVLRP